MQREYPAAPISGVGAIVISAESPARVLVIQRGRPPLQGHWSLPGGVLDLGETLRDGVRREVMEETGLDVEVLAHVETLERIARDAEDRVQYHYVISDWLCRVIGGALQCGDDADDAAWLSEAEIAENTRCPMDGFTRDVIAKALRIHAQMR